VVQSVAPELDWYEPMGHVVHAPWPAASWYFPASHDVHAVAPVAAMVPEAHTKQPVCPVAG
jgi:hypothetical protein